MSIIKVHIEKIQNMVIEIDSDEKLSDIYDEVNDETESFVNKHDLDLTELINSYHVISIKVE